MLEKNPEKRASLADIKNCRFLSTHSNISFNNSLVPTMSMNNIKIQTHSFGY